MNLEYVGMARNLRQLQSFLSEFVSIRTMFPLKSFYGKSFAPNGLKNIDTTEPAFMLA